MSFLVSQEVLWLEKQISMILMASLAPARAEIEAGVVAKADQKQ